MTAPELAAAAVKGFLLGLSIAVPLGPINVEIIRRGIDHHPTHGLALGLGACTVDAAYILLAGLGLGLVLQLPILVLGLNLVGAALLSWMAWGAVASGIARWHAKTLDLGDSKGRTEYSRWRSYGIGIFMTAVNPITIVFWMTVPAGFFGGQEPPLWLALATSAAVLAGCVSWVLFLTGLLAWARSRVTPRLFAIISIVGGIMIAGYAVRFLWAGVGVAGRWMGE